MKNKTKKVPYTSISVAVQDRKKFRELKEKHRKLYSFNGFFEEILNVYEKSICPECNCIIKPKNCSCKATERM
jgi:hypothetical protein